MYPDAVRLSGYSERRKDAQKLEYCIIVFLPELCEGEHLGQIQIYCDQQGHHCRICVIQSSDGLIKPFHCNIWQSLKVRYDKFNEKLPAASCQVGIKKQKERVILDTI